MLTLDQTFRILQKILCNVQSLASPSIPDDDSCDRPSVSPFENPYPWHLLGGAGIAQVEAASSADVDLMRAAYLATFPAID